LGDLPVTFIVGFAKYNSKNAYDKLQKDLTFSGGPCGNHKFHAVESILLPVNEHKVDAWQRELEVLLELVQLTLTLKLPDITTIVKKLIGQLKEASTPEIQGLGDDIFLLSPKNKKMILGATFAFWNGSDNGHEFEHQATVYYTISSILQKLRTVPKKGGVIPLGQGYIIRLLDPLLFDRFNEGIIHASVLRAAKSRELNYSADDDKSKIVGSLIERMIKHPDLKESEGLPEFLLALCTKKLQVKKDHINGLNNHSIDRTKYPFTWLLAEHTKDKLFSTKKEKQEYF